MCNAKKYKKNKKSRRGEESVSLWRSIPNSVVLQKIKVYTNRSNAVVVQFIEESRRCYFSLMNYLITIVKYKHSKFYQFVKLLLVVSDNKTLKNGIFMHY